MDQEIFKVELRSTREQAEFLKAIMVSDSREELEIPPVPIGEIEKFIEGSRQNIWEVTLNDVTYVTIESSKEAATLLLEMVSGAGVDEFPLQPIMLQNITDFIEGKRDHLALLEIVKNEIDKKEEQE